LLESVTPQIERFCKKVEGAPFETAVRSTVDQLKPLKAALEKHDFQEAQQLMQALGEKGQQIEEQVRATLRPVPNP
jgi:hypothetical protein